MKAVLSKTNTGREKSKIIDAKYKTVELVFEVQMSPKEFGEFIEKYNEQEVDLIVKK